MANFPFISKVSRGFLLLELTISLCVWAVIIGVVTVTLQNAFYLDKNLTDFYDVLAQGANVFETLLSGQPVQDSRLTKTVYQGKYQLFQYKVSDSRTLELLLDLE